MNQDKDPDEEYRKDFVDSVIMEELDADTLPAELIAEFGDTNLGQLDLSEELIEDEFWDFSKKVPKK